MWVKGSFIFPFPDIPFHADGYNTPDSSLLFHPLSPERGGIPYLIDEFIWGKNLARKSPALLPFLQQARCQQSPCNLGTSRTCGKITNKVPAIWWFSVACDEEDKPAKL